MPCHQPTMEPRLFAQNGYFQGFSDARIPAASMRVVPHERETKGSSAFGLAVSLALRLDVITSICRNTFPIYNDTRIRRMLIDQSFSPELPSLNWPRLCGALHEVAQVFLQVLTSSRHGKTPTD